MYHCRYLRCFVSVDNSVDHTNTYSTFEFKCVPHCQQLTNFAKIRALLDSNAQTMTIGEIAIVRYLVFALQWQHRLSSRFNSFWVPIQPQIALRHSFKIQIFPIWFPVFSAEIFCGSPAHRGCHIWLRWLIRDIHPHWYWWSALALRVPR